MLYRNMPGTPVVGRLADVSPGSRTLLYAVPVALPMSRMVPSTGAVTEAVAADVNSIRRFARSP